MQLDTQLIVIVEIESIMSQSSLKCLLFAIILIVTLNSSNCKTRVRKRDKLIVILADGFRYDYLDEPGQELPGFQRMLRDGVRAQYVQPVFPTISIPNWYSIASGLYVESHGMMGNHFWDPVTKEMYHYAPSNTSFEPRWWNGGEPIWVTAERNSIRTAMFWWDGCEASVRGVNGTYCRPYGIDNQHMTWNPETFYDDYTNAMDLIVSNFKSDKWGLAMVYYESLDGEGHQMGTKSDERKAALKTLDNILVHLQDNLDKSGLTSKTNVLIVSDHGMIDSGPSFGTKEIRILNHMAPEDVEHFIGGGPLAAVWPSSVAAGERIYRNLTTSNVEGLRVHLKDDIPEKYHFKYNERSPPMIMVAEEGYAIIPLIEVPLIDFGFHGLDPFDVKEMRAAFLAKGPGFRKGVLTKPLVQVDHYNVFCHLLGITPAPNNGSWVRVVEMLSNPRRNAIKNLTLETLVIFVSLFTLLINI